MDPHPAPLPTLTLNTHFVHDLLDATPPCFALGYVEIQSIVSGCFAVRPATPIPTSVTQQGCRFGHRVLGMGTSPILQFVFEFYGHATYHGLVPPDNPIIQAVLTTMLTAEDYFFLAINPDQQVTAFRSHLADPDLAGLRTNQQRFRDAHCTTDAYARALHAFTRRPDPPGEVMTWVCRDNPAYLDRTEHRLDMHPR
ncbi:MAG: hypothetical protein HC828_03235 [Blastochloris sp.]|nr:hypothetical protein [Blastochloris sp.]